MAPLVRSDRKNDSPTKTAAMPKHIYCEEVEYVDGECHQTHHQCDRCHGDGDEPAAQPVDHPASSREHPRRRLARMTTEEPSALSFLRKLEMWTHTTLISASASHPIPAP